MLKTARLSSRAALLCGFALVRVETSTQAKYRPQIDFAPAIEAVIPLMASRAEELVFIS
jgi:hypothetical protein